MQPLVKPLARACSRLWLALGLSSLAAAASADSFVVTNIAVEGGSAAVGVAANAATNKVYVSQTFGKVHVIDGSTNVIATTVVIPSGTPFLGYLAANPVTNKIYVPHNGNNTGEDVWVINGATDTVVAGPIPVGSPANDTGP